MKHSYPELEAALRQIPDWNRQAIELIGKLKGSHSNRSFLIKHQHKQYVVRLDTELTQTLGLQRENEVKIRKLVAAARIAPALLYTDLELGIQISEYVSGKIYSTIQLQDQTFLTKLATRLRHLHALPYKGPAQNLVIAAQRYADVLATKKAQHHVKLLKSSMQNISARRTVLCHNDLHAENIIVGERLWLIDWEYAGGNDPLFELTVFIVHHKLPAQHAHQFLRSYFGYLDAQLIADLKLYSIVYQQLNILWQEVNLAGCATPGGNGATLN